MPHDTTLVGIRRRGLGSRWLPCRYVLQKTPSEEPEQRRRLQGVGYPSRTSHELLGVTGRGHGHAPPPDLNNAFFFARQASLAGRCQPAAIIYHLGGLHEPGYQVARLLGTGRPGNSGCQHADTNKAFFMRSSQGRALWVGRGRKRATRPGNALAAAPRNHRTSLHCILPCRKALLAGMLGGCELSMNVSRSPPSSC